MKTIKEPFTKEQEREIAAEMLSLQFREVLAEEPDVSVRIYIGANNSRIIEIRHTEESGSEKVVARATIRDDRRIRIALAFDRPTKPTD